MRTLSFCNRVVMFLANAQEAHPHSYIAFSDATGEIYFHTESYSEFATELESFRKENPNVSPAIIFPEKKKGDAEKTKIFLAQALQFGRTLSTA